MKTLIVVFSCLLLTPAFAADPPGQSTATPAKRALHRYLVERTFPAGALKGLDAATKKKVNANNASVGVHWVTSYANADETKTFCVYEGTERSGNPQDSRAQQAAR